MRIAADGPLRSRYKLPVPIAVTHAFTSQDQLRIAEASRVLLSPLDYDDADAWRMDANRRLRALLQADKATFMLPADGVQRFFSEEFSPHLQQYPEKVRRLNERYGIWRRQIELGVFDRVRLWQPHLQELHNSAYYNEFVVPLRAFDTIGMSFCPSGEPGPETVASMLFHHDRLTGPRFGSRGTAILRLLFPSFQAGVRAFQRFDRGRLELNDLLRRIDVNVLICDANGDVLHRTPSLNRLLMQDPEDERLLARIHLIGRRVGGTLQRKDPTASDSTQIDRPAVEHVRTRTNRYRLHGCLVRSPILGREGVVLVTVEPAAALLPSLRTLRERFDLTPQQARSAQLLVRRRTNKEMAEALHISPHTARRHTEAVLAKLGVSSRENVATAIWNR